MPKDSVADMVVQFTCYATYKHNFAGIVGHVENGIGRLALDQVKHAVEISVKNNQKQYLRGQKLKETAQAEVSLSKRAAQIIDAKMFLDAFLAGDMDQAKIYAKSFGQPETKNWKHIIAALGLHMNTTEAKRTKVMGPDGKWKNGSRQFKVVMHTFFAPNDIVGQVDGFQFKS